MQTSKHAERPLPDPERRSFLKQAGAVALGAAGILTPVAIGLNSLLDPLRAKGAAHPFVKLATIDALPEDGSPRRFQVFAERIDAWTRHAMSPVGAVFLRRVGPKAVKAFNVICPHAGCHVEFVGDRKEFFCPCHNSSFALDGRVGNPSSPSPRGLDELDVEVRNDAEVWVRFQNFRIGIREKRPLA